MKNIIISIFCMFSSYAMAEGFGISMDKDYYFKKKNDRELEVIVSNDSSKLLFASVFLYEGKPDPTTGKIIFDYKDKVLGYDIYPEQIAIPASQKRKITLIRAAQKSNHSVEKEEYYRIRVIPKSPEEALKTNPQLQELLTSTEKQQLEDSDKTNGTLKVFIGSGSVLVVQKDFDLTSGNIKLDVKKSNIGVSLSVTNKSDSTIYFGKTKVYANEKWVPLGDFAIRGHKAKEILISDSEFKKHGVMKEKIDKLTFTSQDGNEVIISI